MKNIASTALQFFIECFVEVASERLAGKKVKGSIQYDNGFCLHRQKTSNVVLYFLTRFLATKKNPYSSGVKYFKINKQCCIH